MTRKTTYLLLSLLFFSLISCTHQSSQKIPDEESINNSQSKIAKVYVSLNTDSARATSTLLPDEIFYDIKAYNKSVNTGYIEPKENINNLFIFEFNINDPEKGDEWFFDVIGYYKDQNKKIPVLTSKYTEGTLSEPIITHNIKSSSEVDISIDLQLFKESKTTGSLYLPIAIENTNINTLKIRSDSENFNLRDSTYNFKNGNSAEINIDNLYCGTYLTYFDFYNDDVLLYSYPEYINIRQNITTTWNPDNTDCVEEIDGELTFKVTSETVKKNSNPIYVDGNVTNNNNSGTWFNPMTTLSKALKYVNALNSEFEKAGATEKEKNYTIYINDKSANDSLEPSISINSDSNFKLTIKSKNTSSDSKAMISEDVITGGNIDLTLENLSVKKLTVNSPIIIKDCNISDNLEIKAKTELENSKITGVTFVKANLNSSNNTFEKGIEATAHLTSKEDKIYSKLSFDKVNSLTEVSSFTDTVLGSKNNALDLSANQSNFSFNYTKGNSSYIGKTNIIQSTFKTQYTSSGNFNQNVNIAMGNTTFDKSEVDITDININANDSTFEFKNGSSVSFNKRGTSRSVYVDSMIINDSNLNYSYKDFSATKFISTSTKLDSNITFSDTNGKTLTEGVSESANYGLQCKDFRFKNTNLIINNSTVTTGATINIDGGSVSFNRVVFGNGSDITVENTESCEIVADSGKFSMLGQVDEAVYQLTDSKFTYIDINSNSFLIDGEKIYYNIPLDSLTLTNNKKIQIKNTLCMSSSIVFDKNESIELLNSPLCTNDFSIKNCNSITIRNTPYIIGGIGDEESVIPTSISLNESDFKLINTPVEGSVHVNNKSSLILNQKSYIEDVGIIFIDNTSLIKMQNMKSEEDYKPMEIFHQNPKQETSVVIRIESNGEQSDLELEEQNLFENLFTIISPGKTSYTTEKGLFIKNKDIDQKELTALVYKDTTGSITDPILIGNSKDNNKYNLPITEIDREVMLYTYTTGKPSAPVRSVTYSLYDEIMNELESKAFYISDDESEYPGIKLSDFIPSPNVGDKYYLRSTFFTADIPNVEQTTDDKFITITE